MLDPPLFHGLFATSVLVFLVWVKHRFAIHRLWQEEYPLPRPRPLSRQRRQEKIIAN